VKRVTPALVTLLMLGVVGFLVVAYVAKTYLFVGTDEGPTLARRNIPTAIVEIAAGTLITEQHLGQAPIAIADIEPQTLVNSRVILGRIARQTIPPLSQIRTDDLYSPGDGPQIPVEPGKQAVTINLGEEADVVDGLIRPNQYVDVHFHPNQTDERIRQGMVMTLFEGVKVIALNQSMQPRGRNQSGTTVTFEMTESQANVLLLAARHGDIALSYNPNGPGRGTDVAVGQEGRAYLEEILGLDPLPQPFRADQYRGSSRETQNFENGRPVGGALDNRTSRTETPDRVGQKPAMTN
jgi:pilus assembly protein CpaB